jgi:hypothetical protein
MNLPDRIDMNELGVDDVVLAADCFRMERMNDNEFWVCAYNGKVRTTFNISGSGKCRIRATLIEDHELSGL